MRRQTCSRLTPCPHWRGRLQQPLPGPGARPVAHRAQRSLRCEGKKRSTDWEEDCSSLRRQLIHSDHPGRSVGGGRGVHRWLIALPGLRSPQGHRALSHKHGCESETFSSQKELIFMFFIKRIKKSSCILSFKRHSMNIKYMSYCKH